MSEIPPRREAVALRVRDIPFTRLNVILLACVAVFISTLIISSVTATKLWSINIGGAGDIAIPVGTSLFALTFLATDVISEVWGRKYALYVVLWGFLARCITFSFFSFAVWVPPAPAYTNNDAYVAFLGMEGSGIIVIAGLVTYLVSQTNDVLVFHYFREREIEKNRLFKRNLISTFSSQFLDTCVFVIVAFSATLPVNIILQVIVGQLVIKWAIAIVDTPFVYIFRNLAKGQYIFDFSG